MKVVVIHGHAPVLAEERMSLIRGLVDRGHEVHVLAPHHEPDLFHQFEEAGAQTAMFPLSRRTFTPIADISTMLHLKQVLFRIRPELVLSFTAKPIIYGSMAARLAWVGDKKRVFALVGGLGYAFTRDSGLRRRLLFALYKTLFRSGFKSCDGIMFRSAEDEAFFRKLEVLPEYARTTVLAPAGPEEDRELVDQEILSFLKLL